MVQALETAIRAQENAQNAQHRIDRMNGSIDAMREEVAKVRAELVAELRLLTEQISGLKVKEARSSTKTALLVWGGALLVGSGMSAVTTIVVKLLTPG